MKTTGIFVRTMLLLLLFQFSTAYTQVSADPLSGAWEGKFMGDFRTVLEITSPSPGNYTGTIRMYSGPQIIQNDPLNDITLNGKTLAFQIPAKETSFTGKIGKDSTTLSGQFIFPDGSEHPIQMTRLTGSTEPGTATSEPSSEAYESLRVKTLTPDEMAEDLQVLEESLKKYHPRLCSYTPMTSMNRLVDSIARSLDEPLPLVKYFRGISPVVNAVHCSHTGIRLPEAYRQLSAQCGKFLPLSVLCTRDGLFLIRSVVVTEHELPPGSRILSINGKSSESICRELMTLVPSEGWNISGKYYQMSKHFAWYYHLLDPSEVFEVEFLPPSSINAAYPSSHLAYAFTGCNLDRTEPDREVPTEAVPLIFNISEGGKSAILRVPSFAIMNMDGYMTELDRIFGQLASKDIPNLILDLRGNDGGHPIFAAQLLSYLVRGEFTYFRRNPDAAEFEPLYHPMSPDPSAYQGTIYVLTDGGCLSTTGHLLSLIQYHSDAIFIGEEPGSSFRCNDFSVQIVLPNSGIEANIPRTTFETAVPSGSGAGIKIDYPVVPEPSDIASGTDRVMFTCMTLIGET